MRQLLGSNPCARGIGPRVLAALHQHRPKCAFYSTSSDDPFELTLGFAEEQNRALGAWRGLQLPDPVVQAMVKLKHLAPLAIQSRAIPPLLQNQNVVIEAEEGSGKTLAFLLPLLTRLINQRPTHANAPLDSPVALIVVPSVSRVRQMQRILRDLINLTRIPLGVKNAITQRQHGMTERTTAYVLVSTAPALFAKNPWSMRRLEEQLCQTKVVIIDELLSSLNTFSRAEVHRLMHLLTTGLDRHTKVTQASHVPTQPKTYRLHSPNLLAHFCPKQFIITSSTEPTSPDQFHSILDEHMGIRPLTMVSQPFCHYRRPRTDEFLVYTPSLSLSQRIGLTLDTLRILMTRIRRLEFQGTHRLVLVHTNSMHETKLMYEAFTRQVREFSQWYQYYQTYGQRPATPGAEPPVPQHSHLFHVQSELFFARTDETPTHAMKARLHQPLRPRLMDPAPPGIPAGAGPISVVFVANRTYRDFVFPNVTCVLLTEFPPELHTYQLWAGKAGHMGSRGELITFVDPSKRVLSATVCHCNSPRELTAVDQLADIPIASLPLVTRKGLPPIDGTNLTGVAKANEMADLERLWDDEV